MTAQAWVVRAGRDDEYEQADLAGGALGIGWRRVGDLTSARTLAAVRTLVAAAYPEVQPATQEAYALQLHAFRSAMRPGDPVVLVRRNAPEVALGEIAGDYRYTGGGAGPVHQRDVRWLRRQVARSDLDADLLDVPALTAVYRLTRTTAVTRLRAVAAGGEPPPRRPPAARRRTPLETLRLNLGAAGNLVFAGKHLAGLEVGLIEVQDVYRAAWVQAVASLDHWVRQEVHARMLHLAEDPGAARPPGYDRYQLPLSLTLRIQRGETTLRDELDAVLADRLGRTTFQDPDDIRDGFKLVADVAGMWPRVATLLKERADRPGGWDSAGVQAQLREIVRRRNKIAHEYDDDPAEPSGKRRIDEQATMGTIRFIEQVAEAVLEVVGPVR